MPFAASGLVVARTNGTQFDLARGASDFLFLRLGVMPVWFLVIPLVFAAEPAPVRPIQRASTNPVAIVASINPAASSSSKSLAVSQRSTKAASDHFVVYSVAGAPAAEEIAQLCESRCAELRAKWLGLTTPVDWNVRCDVVLHASQEGYLAAVGRSGVGTLGSSLVQFKQDQIASRRIDLLARDERSALSALPHELTHIVLADRFGQKALPRWADEGIATLADPSEKQRLHLMDLQRGLAAGSTLRLTELLFATEYPPSAQRALYYGSSLALVRYLSTLDRSERVLDFVEKAMQSGHRTALREVYGLESLAQLERGWRKHLQQYRN